MYGPSLRYEQCQGLPPRGEPYHRRGCLWRQVMRPAASPLHRARLGKDELAVVVNPATGQLLKYEDLSAPSAAARRRSHLAVDAHLFGEHDVLSARTDLLDCQVGRLPCGDAIILLCSMICQSTTLHSTGILL